MKALIIDDEPAIRETLQMTLGSARIDARLAENGDAGLAAIESPDVWFEDVGAAELVDGRAVVTIEPLYAEVASFFGAQVAAGRIRPIEPLLAAQAVVGPLFFHLLGQSISEPVTGATIAPEHAAMTFAQVALHGLLPSTQESLASSATRRRRPA